MTPCLAGLNILGLPLSTLPLGWLATRSAVVLPAACAWAGQPRPRAAPRPRVAFFHLAFELSCHTALRSETCFAAGGGMPRGRGLDLVNLVNLTRLDSRAVARPPAPPAALHLVRSAQRWPVATTL